MDSTRLARAPGVNSFMSAAYLRPAGISGDSTGRRFYAWCAGNIAALNSGQPPMRARRKSYFSGSASQAFSAVIPAGMRLATYDGGCGVKEIDPRKAAAHFGVANDTDNLSSDEQGNSLIGADTYVTSGRRAGATGRGHVAVGLTDPHTYDVERSDVPPTRSLRRHVVETERSQSRIISARPI